MSKWIILASLGVLLGACLALWAIRQLMKKPSTRIWLSDWVNWSNNTLPQHSHQLVRHGKWIADLPPQQDTHQ